jgi:predicted metal-dependent hydrolase
MSKGERISRLVAELVGSERESGTVEVATHSFYRAFFRCWNEQHYYEAHDVLEQLWLKTNSSDADFFKGLIQAAGAFVHLQKNFEHPTHPKHRRRLHPAVRLFQLAEKNLAPYPAKHHAFDIEKFINLLREEREKIMRSDFAANPWSPEKAPKLELLV